MSCIAGCCGPCLGSTAYIGDLGGLFIGSAVLSVMGAVIGPGAGAGYAIGKSTASIEVGIGVGIGAGVVAGVAGVGSVIGSSLACLSLFYKQPQVNINDTLDENTPTLFVASY